ncbi:uncharacterized protein LOC114742412 [Neltuma alba]|uniref:uncharacterized protein LOC114742412 n=1 Tax=Neltuma alba TaxID=207710 RepID=UPI0010A4452C|nr:uncharacterized protein LOC114742412 [Prosopis alba]
MLKIDRTTAFSEKGGFARICMEVDLEKPLLPAFMHFGEVHKILYEGLHLICFRCGQYGHHKEQCPTGIVEAEKTGSSSNAHCLPSESNVGSSISTEKPTAGTTTVNVDSNIFGPHMIVKRSFRTRLATHDTDKSQTELVAKKTLAQPAAVTMPQKVQGTDIQVHNNHESDWVPAGSKKKLPGSRKLKGKENILGVKLLGQSKGKRDLGKNEARGKLILSNPFYILNGGTQEGQTNTSSNAGMIIEAISHVQASKLDVGGGPTTCTTDQGTGSRSFPQLVRELTSFYSLDFVAILETRCSGAKAVDISKKLGFQFSEIVDAEGFSGGIWCLWSYKIRCVECVSKSPQFIHLKIETYADQVWWFTVVYASPVVAKRRPLWRELLALQCHVNGPWCVTGDFNATISASERSPAGAIDRDFNSFVLDSNLSDMGFLGPRFTWKRNTSESRIDRVLSNPEWLDVFRDASITHLPFFKSDHRPLLLKLHRDGVRQHGNRPFRFIASWALHEDFKKFVRGNWKSQVPWTENIHQFTSACTTWNKEVFGHTNSRKKSLLCRLEGISRVEARVSLSPELLDLQRQLGKELDEVLLQESLIWAQKARSDWQIYGDKNTKYYHNRANNRRKRNFIGAIKNELGDWVYNAESIKSMATAFFSHLFTEDQPAREPIACSITYPPLKEEDQTRMVREVGDIEIKEALFSMGALKAPGPDGLNPLFYQSQWDHVGASICSFIKHVWRNPDGIANINDTYLVLIPKVDHPEMLRDLRPIGLCNVIFKIITKIIANRLKPCLSYMISPTQCSFIPSRHSSDNIIVAQEVVHSMRIKQGYKGFMAIKIDLEKAYDRVNWNFLINCLNEMQIPTHVTQIISHCISLAKMQLLWNGEKTEEFKPTRGVQQGDPISPYLFVICMEKLAQMIQERVNKNEWTPISLCKQGPPLSHLFFADDIILFSEVSIHQAAVIHSCLEEFYSRSGLKVNVRKTRVSFSRNVNHTRRSEVSNILGFQLAADLGKYLGAPLHHRRISKSSYQEVVDKVKQRLSNWKANSLSLAGRITLASSVTSAIPEYSIQTASLPISTCEAVEKHNRCFIWGSSEGHRKPHLVAWDKVCTPKKNGGLGLKHLRHQNQAYMAKLGWNLINRRDALWVKVIRTKYRCGSDLIPTIDHERPGSNIWKGIKDAWKYVQEGVQTTQGNIEARWRYDRNGVFSIKSAYSLITQDQQVSNPIWSKIWKLQVLQRCKTFMWLSLHNKLLTNQARVERGMVTTPICTWCGSHCESLLHVLRDCDDTRCLWSSMVKYSLLDRFFSLELTDWLQFNIRNPGGSFGDGWSEFFATICWLLWSSRNERIFEGKWTPNAMLIAKARHILSNLKQAATKLRGSNLNGHRVTVQGIKWSPPPPGWVKLNVDGAFSTLHGAGCGGILRNHVGSFISGFMFHPNDGDSLAAELWALVCGLKMTWDFGFRKVIVETDASEVIRLLYHSSDKDHHLLQLISEARSMVDRSWEVDLGLIPRSTNEVADHLAKKALRTAPGLHLFSFMTEELRELVMKDYTVEAATFS